MRVAVPHQLPKEEVRRRLRTRIGDLGNYVPGGVADVQTGWPSEDRMTLQIAAMGQTLTGEVQVEERQVVFQVTLPPALSFFSGVVENAIRENAPKLLEKK